MIPVIEEGESIYYWRNRKGAMERGEMTHTTLARTVSTHGIRDSRTEAMYHLLPRELSSLHVYLTSMSLDREMCDTRTHTAYNQLATHGSARERQTNWASRSQYPWSPCFSLSKIWIIFTTLLVAEVFCTLEYRVWGDQHLAQLRHRDPLETLSFSAKFSLTSSETWLTQDSSQNSASSLYRDHSPLTTPYDIMSWSEWGIAFLSCMSPWRGVPIAETGHREEHAHTASDASMITSRDE